MKRILLIIVAVLSVLIVSAWYTVFHTAYGVEFLLGQLTKLRSMQIVITGVEGTLSGPLMVKHFELDHQYIHLVADDIRLSIVPRALFSQTIRISDLSIGSVTATTKPVDDAPSTAALHFFTPLLLLRVDSLDIGAARFTHYNGFTQAAQQLHVSAKLTAQRLQISDLAITTDKYSATGSVALRAQRPIPLDANLNVRAPTPQGADIEGTVKVSGNIEQMNFAITTQSPSPAQATAVLTRDAQHWQIAGQAVSPTFSLEPWLQRPPFSLQQAQLAFTIQPQLIHITGDVTVPELDTLPLHVDASGNYASNVLSLTAATVNLSNSDSVVTAVGSLTFGEERLFIDAAAHWQDLHWPLRSSNAAAMVISPRGELTMVGNQPYSFTTQAELLLRQTIPAQVTAAGELNETTVHAQNFALHVFDGRVGGSGSLNFKKQAWQLTATAANLNPQSLYAPLQGTIAFDAHGSGQGFGKNADFTLAVPSLRGKLRNEELTGVGGVVHNSKGWNVQQVALKLGNAELLLSGKYADTMDFNWSLNAPALERFLANARGSIHTQGSVQGTYLAPHVDATLRADNIAYGTWQASSIAASADTHLAGDDASHLEITVHDLRSNKLALGSPRLTADMSAVKITNYSLIQRERWNVDRFCIAWPSSNESAIDNSDRQLCGAAQWARNGEWTLQASSDELPLNMFDDSIPHDARYHGHWQVSMKAQASPSMPVTGEANVRVTDAALTHQPIEGEEETVQLGTGQVNVVADTIAILATAKLITPSTTSIDASARIERGKNTAFIESPLRGELHAKTADANLLPLIFPDIDHSAGELKADMAVKGSLALPELSGRIEVTNGELALYRYNLSLREMGLVADFVDNRLEFDGSALAGEGRMRINGQMAWHDLVPEGQLHFTGDRLTIADLPEYRILASPDVKFAIADNRIDISGEIFIPTARLQPTDLRGATQISADARLTTTPPADEKKRGFDIYSEVKVRLGDDVRIDTLGLQGTLGGNVTTIAQPDDRAIGRGELSVSEGKYEAYGQKLAISRGRLLFNSSPLDDPGLDIQAARDIEEQRVGVNVRGTLRAPRITLFAEPALTQTQIVSYLLTGKPLDDLKSQDKASVGLARDSLALQGGGVLASQLGRRIGIEEVGIESHGDNDTALVLGKFLSPRLFVSYGISLTEAINTVKLRYTLSDRWLFKSEIGQIQSADLEFHIQH